MARFFQSFFSETSSSSKKPNPIIENLRKGNCFVTNGPLLKIVLATDNGIFNMGSTSKNTAGLLQIHIKSSPEFGKIQKVRILKGIIGHKKEVVFITVNNLQKFNYFYEYEIYTARKCYYRYEAEMAGAEGTTERILSIANPIWLSPDG